MSFKDFFQAEILLGSGVEPVYTLPNLIHFHMNALTFPWEIVEISIVIWLALFLFLLSQLETSVSLAVDYSKYPGIMWQAGLQIDLYTHPSCSSAAKTTTQHSYANPAIYTG